MTVPEGGKRDRSKIRISELAFGAFFAVFANLKIFASLAAIPFAIEFLADATLFDGAGSGNDELIGWRMDDPRWWGSEMLGALLTAVFAVAWHRFVLLGQRDSAVTVQFRFGLREAKFFLYLLLLTLPFDLFDPSTSPFLSSSSDDLRLILVSSGIFVLYLVVWIRFSFIFPALSVNADHGLGAAWRETKGVSWRVYWALTLVLLTWTVVERVVSFTEGLITQSATGAGAYAALAIDVLLGYLGYAAVIGVVSLAYKRHTEWAPGK